MRDDHVLHFLRIDVEQFQGALGRMDHPAAAASADPGVEAGVDDERAGLRAREPDEIVEIARALVRVPADEVLARLAAGEARVPDREDFVGVGNGSPFRRTDPSGVEPTASARMLKWSHRRFRGSR